MSSVSQLAEILEETLEVQACKLARETGFIKRERAFDGADFAQSLIFGWLQVPQETLDGLRQVLGRCQVKISASGLCQRFTEQSASFFERLLSRLTQEHLQADAQVKLEVLQRFSAVCIEDSSTVSLPQALAGLWAGCGESRGATAAVKLSVRWELTRGKLEGPCLMAGRQSDQRSPLSLESLPVGSLYVADLGYFSLERFCQICGRRGKHRRKARRYFLSRYLPGTGLLARDGKPLSLPTIVPRAVGERKEGLALLGKSKRLPVRLLMERVPAEVAEQRRERLREAAADHGKEPEAMTLWLCDWTIVVTNVPRRLLSFDEVLVLLRARWQIELLFKLWKQEGVIDEWRSLKPWRILSELYAKLCAMLIQHWLIVAGCWADPHRSLVKAAQVVRREAGNLQVALREGRLEAAIRTTLDCMESGCRLDTRKQQPSTAQLLEGAALPAKRPRPPCQRRHRDQGQRWPAGRGWASNKPKRAFAKTSSP
jgi:hypothetical protein